MDASIIIPVYNDPDGLETTVKSLLKQKHNNFEIIISDNGSDDETPKVAKRYAKQDHIHYVIEDDIQGSYAARNAGIEEAVGTVLGFLDADTWVDTDYINKVVEAVVNEQKYYIGCHVKIVGEENFLARYNKSIGFPVDKYIHDSGFAPTNCLAVNRKIFDIVGKFDSRLRSSGDVIFGRKVKEAGFELHYEPHITVYHPARSTLQEHISKAIRIGQGRQQARKYDLDQDIGRSILHPRNYLPPDPIYFLEKIDDNINIPELIVWYFLSWFLNWCTTYGRISEKIGG